MPSAAACCSTRSRRGPLPASTSREAGWSLDKPRKGVDQHRVVFERLEARDVQRHELVAPDPVALAEIRRLRPEEVRIHRVGDVFHRHGPKPRSFWMLVPLAIKASALFTPPRGS
jgi:hypothetical protein